MRIVFTQRLNSLWQRKIEVLREIDTAGEAPELIEAPEPGPDELGEAEVLVGSRITADFVHAAPRLRAVLVPFTGVNSLPLDLLRQRGIRVANSHGNARSVAERAVAMLLAFYGRIIPFDSDLRHGQWHGFAAGRGLHDSWESIEGKSAAVLGVGAIGTEIAKLLRAFGVTVTGLRRGGNSGPPEFDAIFTSLHDAIRGKDVVIVALPATLETVSYIGAGELEQMAGAVLVNIGRGDIVEERPLYDALKDGTLRGACIDTWYHYPSSAGGLSAPDATLPGDAPFHELENVILSPHVGGYTARAAERSIDETVENLRRFITKGEFLHEVKLDQGY
ncbi:MAG: hydroxyacid dehydrogenase [Spirochaetes bacterium]|jgi:phosphoglycerate dehydrogenase-like enzyme|nr:hydroxyacid dehydrogenase [Spirochaetota bacterium]